MTDATCTPDTATCTRCVTSLPASEFFRDARRPSGLKEWCKGCVRTFRASRSEGRADAIRKVTFGVEIETVGLRREPLARALAHALGGTARYAGGSYDAWKVELPDGRAWNVMRDGSLTDGFGGAEIVSPICKFEDIAQVQVVVRAARAAGARVDSSCGIHVHVGVDQLGPQGCARLVRLVAANEPAIVAMLAVLPNRQRYCARLDRAVVERVERTRPATMDALAAAWYGPGANEYRRGVHYDESRYHGLNLHSAFFRGTVEFRWFNSTLHAGKVRACIMLALGLASKAIVDKAVYTTPAQPTREDAAALLNALHVAGPDFENCREHLLAGFAQEVR